MAFVYLSCAGTREIHSFRLDAATGALAPLDSTPVPGSDGPSPSNMPLAFGPGGTRLYAALRSPPFAAASFAVDRASGRLAALGTATLSAPMAYVSVADGGRLLLGASYKEGRISVSRIGADGVVEALPTQVLVTPPKAHCIVSGRDGTVYASTVEGDAILVFRLDAAAGRLLPAEPPSVALRPGSGPRHLAFHPQHDVLYCINELAGTLAAFAVAADGGLRALQYEALTPPGFTGNARAADLHLTPDGRFAYASVRNTHELVGFRVDAAGGLALVGRFPAEKSPRGFNIDPSGRWLLCAGQEERTLAVYEIDPASGALAFRHRRQVAENPQWVEVLPQP